MKNCAIAKAKGSFQIELCITCSFVPTPGYLRFKKNKKLFQGFSPKGEVHEDKLELSYK